MTVLLVGSARARARLRPQLAAASLDVLEEFTTIGEARRAAAGAEAIVIAPDAAAEDELVEELTPREIEVLELLAEGLPNKTIAARLGISDQTVKFHVASISGKLGASNRTDAVRRGVRQGLVSL